MESDFEGCSLARLPSYDPELIWEVLANEGGYLSVNGSIEDQIMHAFLLFSACSDLA